MSEYLPGCGVDFVAWASFLTPTPERKPALALSPELIAKSKGGVRKVICAICKSDGAVGVREISKTTKLSISAVGPLLRFVYDHLLKNGVSPSDFATKRVSRNHAGKVVYTYEATTTARQAYAKFSLANP